MTFYLSKLFWIVAKPGNFILLIAFFGLLLQFSRRRAFGRALVVLCVLAFGVVAVLPIDSWLVQPLENRFPTRSDAPPRVDGIIVLGGAVDPFLTADHAQPSVNNQAERMTEFVALARRFPDARLVFTGGVGAIRAGSLTEADVARQLFEQLGLPPARVAFEQLSRDTLENAVYTKALMRPQPDETWILVTSGFHMPRSVGVFRKHGWPVVPWPVDFRAGGREARSLEPNLGARLQGLDIAMHEWIGLVAYYWLGRTDALFPGP
jgi:uncharacterized SAM-binding protein YcdF (DUF218 family)